MDRKRIVQLALLLIVAAYAHNLFHEFGHWLVGTILGNQMSSFSLTLGNFAAQDEAGISASLGLGKYTVAIIVCSLLLALVWKGSLKLKLGFVALNGWIFGSTVCMLIVIYTHKLFR